MQDGFQIVCRKQKDCREKQAEAGNRFLNQEEAKKVLAFHKSFPMYRPTPLVSLHETAKVLGLGEVYVKDESFRFGLNAFKVLGGSYAIGRYMAGKLGKDISELNFETMISDEAREEFGELTFVTATDGNHGRGVAWTASQLGQKSVVYMPKGSAWERLENIREVGADAEILDMNYDDAVRYARKQAEEHDWTIVQDTSWEGYEDIPSWIMQGYLTMGLEAFEQIPKKPTHIFLQAGVGAMAGAVTALAADWFQEEKPVIVIVEPNKADCLFQTARADDGKLHFVTGDMDTIMAGLACGEPCGLGWEILSEYADCFISCPDYAAAKGMRILGNPAKGDTRVISGESGAAGFGCAAEIMTNPELSDIKRMLGLNHKSRVLFFSTEGDTDQVNYKAIVWDGMHAAL